MTAARLRVVGQERQEGPRLIGRFEPGSDDWQVARMHRIGGSEIGSIMGLGFASWFVIFMRKKGLLPPLDDNEQMYWGRAHERTILARYRREIEDSDPDLFVMADGASFVHQDHDWMLATPDAFVRRVEGEATTDVIDRLVEIKTAGRADGWAPSGSTSPAACPPGYRCQVLWTLHVLGVRRADLVVLIGGSDYRVYPINLDTDPDAAEDLALMLEWGEQFIDDLRNNRWPEPGDGSDATYQASRELHPDIDPGTRVEIDKDLAGDFTLTKIELDAAAARWNAIRGRMITAMGSAEHADLNGERVAIRRAKKNAAGEFGTPYVEADRTNIKRLTAAPIKEQVKK